MLSFLVAAGFSLSVQAAPFESCPSEAFLTQSKPALLYGVDLTTGSYDELGDLNTPDKLNAMGFSRHDGFLYAWYYEGQTLARIHSDYFIEPLTLSPALPMDYFVGDVGVVDNAYYMYRRGGSYNGLWRVALDPLDSEYLQPVRVVSGSVLNIKIFDLAFHPDDGFAYSVDSAGRLWQIDTAGSAPVNLGNVGQSGTFGAVYFDVNGTLYISRNKDGKIFSIDIAAANPTASLFSYGPSSSNNDGARCALAPVIPPSLATLDFGDAPDTYGTRLESDGARHTVGTLVLGVGVDPENRAFLAPDESDDTKDGSDDEDGLQFLTDLAIGEQALVEVAVTGTGYLNLWIDYNRDGVFAPSELAIDDSPVTSGTRLESISVPASAQNGTSWARARLSSSPGLGPTGAAPDGEVEDYPVTLLLPSTNTQHYPSAQSYVTLAFEDLWPSRGDYDMNDFVVYYRTAITRDAPGVASPRVREIRISGEIVAVGAAFHSGFAVSLPGVLTRDVDAAGIELLINNEVPIAYDTGQPAPFEPLRGTVSRLDETALLEVTRDVWTTVERGEGCFFHRTDNNCGAAASATFDLRVPITGDVPASAVQPGVFNPFIFATNDRLRNSIFTDAEGNQVAPGDALEIHLKNQLPSWRADAALLGRAIDRSIAGSDPVITYQNAEGLPWAIEIGGRWCHPSEYQDITVAYPQFATFVTSEGAQASDWFYVENAATHPERGEAGYLYRENGVLDPACTGGTTYEF